MDPVQYYEQRDDGAIDIDGAAMNRGWYFIARKTYADGAYGAWGKSYGPYRTRAAAQQAYTQTKDQTP